MEKLIAWALTTLVSAFVGSYLAGYLKKKGENLATHEDLDKLVKQMEATTEATKAIEARISDEIWNKQRQWELKREIIVQLIRSISNVDNALMELHSVFADPLPTIDELLVITRQGRLTKSQAWNAANIELDSAAVIASLVAGPELTKASFGVTYALRLAGKAILDGNTSQFMNAIKTIFKLKNGVLVAAQRELGLEVSDFLVTFQSSGSSAAQDPDS